MSYKILVKGNKVKESWKYFNEELGIYTLEESFEFCNKIDYEFNTALLRCGFKPTNFESLPVSENLYAVVIRNNKHYLVDNELEGMWESFDNEQFQFHLSKRDYFYIDITCMVSEKS